MVDEKIIKKLLELRDKEKNEPQDAITLFNLYKRIIEEDEEIQEELDDMDEITVQNIYSDADFKYWVKLGKGNFQVGEGEIDEPDITMSANTETWSGLGSGEIDSTSAYMSGDLSVEGNLQDAMAYGEILDMIRFFLEDLEE